MAKPRKPLPRSTKPLKRSELPRARTPIKVRGKPRFKGRVDEAFREYVREQPCVLVGRGECWGVTECAHVQARSLGGADRNNIVPLCHKHHAAQHQNGRDTFEREWKLDLRYLAILCDAAYESEYGGRYTREHDA